MRAGGESRLHAGGKDPASCASRVRSSGHESIRRWCVRISNWSRDALLTMRRPQQVETPMRVGQRRAGPRTDAGRLAVSTISSRRLIDQAIVEGFPGGCGSSGCMFLLRYPVKRAAKPVRATRIGSGDDLGDDAGADGAPPSRMEADCLLPWRSGDHWSVIDTLSPGITISVPSAASRRSRRPSCGSRTADGSR